MDDRARLALMLENYPKEIQSGVRVVTPTDLGQSYLYHISENVKLTSMIPNISRRTAIKEDRRIPRISVAPTLFGCIGGHAATLYQWENPDDKLWKGGWRIYGLPFQMALAPNKKLVSDVEVTDEHWLVSYSKDTVSYSTVVMGEFFFTEVGQRRVAKDTDITRVAGYLRVAPGFTIRLNEKSTLGPGYYEVVWDNFYHAYYWKQTEGYSVKGISEAAYRAAKKPVADMLSYQPPSLRW